ncbi:MAG: carbohydrate ABC transporter permease [Oscillospiraceae bacterium]|nr:carbohydrate ABC transporter permease [Oscillospiraceae bacterium]
MVNKFSKYSLQDKILLILGFVLLGVFALLILVPLLYIIFASFTNPTYLQNHGLTLDSSKLTLDAYQRVFEDSSIWIGFKNAIVYSVVFTALSVLVTLLAAYPMSLKDFRGRKFFNTVFLITMFFNGGLIPTYLLIKNMGLIDSMWSIILPGCFSVWNMIIARTYYESIPHELCEAAELDGANDLQYFFRILLPICKPIVFILVLWQFVGMWNSYYSAMIYINDPAKQPLQLVLRGILIQNQPQPGMIADIASTAQRSQMAELLKYATIIISSIPLLVMYPFFQKYFQKGITIGSVKG